MPKSSFALLYHPGFTLQDRMDLFALYAKKYHTRLYQLTKPNAFPWLLNQNVYQESDFMSADGIMVGEELFVLEPVLN